MRNLSEIINGLMGALNHFNYGQTLIENDEIVGCLDDARNILCKLSGVPTEGPIYEHRPFWVLDKNTGKEADPYEIALKEEWAHNLIYCDMEGFALLEDGSLYLLDECGRYEYCDPNRFKVIWTEENDDSD